MAVDLSNLVSNKKALNPFGAAVGAPAPSAPSPVVPQERPTEYGDRLQSKIEELSAKQAPSPLPTFDIPAPTAQRQIGAFAPDSVGRFTEALGKGDYSVTPAPSEPSLIPSASAGENAPDDLVQTFLNDESQDYEARKTVFESLKNGDDPVGIESYLKEKGYQPGKTEEEPGFWQNLDVKAKERFGKALDIAESGQSWFSQALQTGGQAAGFIGDIFGEALVSGYKMAGEPGKEKAKELLNTDTGKKAMWAIADGMEAWNEFKKENPEFAGNVEAVVNIASLVPIGKGAKYVGEGAVEGAEVIGKSAIKGAKATGEALGTGAGKTTEFVANQITGLTPETRSLIKESPELFQAAKSGEISPVKLAEEFKTALENRKSELSSMGKGYENMRTGTKIADGSQIENAFLDATKDVNFKNLTKEDASAIEEAGKYLDRYSKGDVTDTDLLSLRHQLDSTVSWDKNVSKYGESVVKSMRAKIDGIINQKIPGAKALDAKYAEERQLLDSVLKNVLNPDGTLKDNAISTIMNLTGKWKEVKIRRFLEIVPGMDDKIRALKAWEDVSNTAAQKVGQYVKGGLLGWALATSNVPLAVVGFIATNPYVAAFVLQKYGMAKAAIKSVLSKSVSKAEFEPSEVESVLKAFDSVPKSEVEKAIIESPVSAPERVGVPKISIKQEVLKSKVSK